MKKILKVIKSILIKIDEDNISEFAAEISFFTILSLAPFIIFFFSIFRYTNFDNEIICFILNDFIPKGTEKFFYDLINEHSSKYLNIISLSGIIALWSASKGVFSLIKGIRSIYDYDEDKSIINMKCEACLYTIILIFFILLIITVMMLLKKIKNDTRSKIIVVIFEIFSKIQYLFVLLLIFFLLFSIYTIIPRKYKYISRQIPGAFFSTIAWYLVTLFFSIYINIFKNFYNIYGSLGTIILVMIWLYVSMYVVLIGAEINITYKRYKKY